MKKKKLTTNQLRSMSSQRYPNHSSHSMPNRGRRRNRFNARKPYDRNNWSSCQQRTFRNLQPLVPPLALIQSTSNQRPNDNALTIDGLNQPSTSQSSVFAKAANDLKNLKVHLKKHTANFASFRAKYEPHMLELSFKPAPNRKWLDYHQKLFHEIQIIDKIFTSDSYNEYKCTLPKGFSDWIMRISMAGNNPIPDSNKDDGKCFLIHETFEYYEKITRPYMETDRSKIEWINKILHHDAESEKVIYKEKDDEKGFVMLNNGMYSESPDKIEYLAIPFQTIHSLRELNETHISLLEHILDIGTSEMKKRRNLSPSEYKVYVHYPPAYFHLHVHFTNIDFRKSGEHLLQTVINNIKLVSNYYQRAELPFVLKGGEDLWKKYLERGILMPSNDSNNAS